MKEVDLQKETQAEKLRGNVKFALSKPPKKSRVDKVQFACFTKYLNHLCSRMPQLLIFVNQLVHLKMQAAEIHLQSHRVIEVGCDLLISFNQSRLLRTMPNWILNICKDDYSTTSPGILYHCSALLQSKRVQKEFHAL